MLYQLLYHEEDLIDLYAELICRNSTWERSIELIQDIYYALVEHKCKGHSVSTPEVWEHLKLLENCAVNFQLYELAGYVRDAAEHLEEKGKVGVVINEIRKYHLALSKYLSDI